MTTNDPVADESSDTTDAQTETLCARHDSAMVPVGKLIYPTEIATDGGEDTDDHTPRTESVCMDCGASYPTSGSCDCGGIEEL